jgi:hypothetical protein
LIKLTYRREKAPYKSREELLGFPLKNQLKALVEEMAVMQDKKNNQRQGVIYNRSYFRTHIQESAHHQKTGATIDQTSPLCPLVRRGNRNFFLDLRKNYFINQNEIVQKI